jgi:hypothetical protein
MTYAIDEARTVHAIRTDSHIRSLCCGRAGQWRILHEFPEGGALCEFCALYMLPEVIVEGFHLRTMARICRELERPTGGPLAGLVWRLSTTSLLGITLAEDFMRACGYVPFCGFPLVHLKTPNLESVKQ